MLKNYFRLLVLLLIVFALIYSNANSRHLIGKSRIEFAGGMWLDEDSPSVRVSYDRWDDHFNAEGSVGSITFSTWQNENMAMTISFSALDYRETDYFDITGSYYTEKSMVNSLLLGFRLYPGQTSRYNSWHPFVSFEGGPYFAFSNEQKIDRDTYYFSRDLHHEQTVIGMRVGGGVDIELSRFFMVGMNAGYNFMPDFSQPLNEDINYSGGDIRFSLSLLFGGRR